jgi:hypothetical protein
VLATLLLPTGIEAQGYRVRFEARAQSVTYRGLARDSIPADHATPAAGRGLVSPDGFAVTCSSPLWCYYFRPGPRLHAVPMVATATTVLWGLGVEGLTIHTTARVVAQAGNAEAWPTTSPAAQIVEGYVELTRSWFTGQLGRLLLVSRLEPVGFDGAWARARWDRPALELSGYAGWGLAQAAVVPVSSPLLNPLNEWRPTRRQLVTGAELAWSPGPVDARAEYRREVDPELNYFVSERTALSATARPIPSLLAAGGLDYNIAEGVVGTADVTLSWLHPRITATAGARRYRPFFNLWTLWGAFSPVPYHAAHAGIEARPAPWLALRIRGERYRYDAAEASTALVRVENSGWRTNLGGTATMARRWTATLDYLLEYGPGAASRFLDAGVTYQPTGRLRASLYGGRVFRPLEFRFYDATATWIGGRTEWRFHPQMGAWVDAAWYRDRRDRPDPAATAWNQVRLSAGIRWTFGTDADRLNDLPPARRATP